MSKLTHEQKLEMKRDFKVLLISSCLYGISVAAISAIFTFQSVASFVAPLFFLWMWIVDKKLK